MRKESNKIGTNLEILGAVGNYFSVATQVAKIANGKESTEEIQEILNKAIAEIIELAKEGVNDFMFDKDTDEFDFDAEYIDNDDDENNDLEEFENSLFDDED